MMRDFVMALVLLGLAAIPIAVWCGGQPHVKVQNIQANLGR